MDEDSEKQVENRHQHLAPWQYKKGQSGNVGGRPKGAVSMKTYIKNKLACMTPEEREEFLEGIDKKVLWEMAEGKAESRTEVTGKDGGAIEHKIVGMTILNDSGVQDKES